MRRPRVIAAACAVGVYVAGALTTGALNPALRFPLLDGTAPPAAYQWVKPPPALAKSNQPPSGASDSLAFKDGKSQTGIISTPDLQATADFPEDAFAPKPGAASVAVTITPLTPRTAGLPDGFAVSGNVYRVQGVYKPQGPATSGLQQDGAVTLVYPADGTVKPGRVLFASLDGKKWEKLDTSQNAQGDQVLARVRSLGYFVVGVQPLNSGSPWPYVVVAAIVLVVALAVVEAVLVRRKRRSRGRSSRSPRRSRK